jgi:hypothetical protein
VTLGEIDKTNDPDCIENVCNPPKLTLLAEEVTIHEKYVDVEGGDDIALIRLPEAVNFTTNIRPICLPTDASLKDFDYAEKTLTAAGWGEFNEEPKLGRKSDCSLEGYTVGGGVVSDTLLKVDLDGVSNVECNDAYEQIFDSQLCAGGVEGEDTC